MTDTETAFTEIQASHYRRKGHARAILTKIAEVLNTYDETTLEQIRLLVESGGTIAFRPTKETKDHS